MKHHVKVFNNHNSKHKVELFSSTSISKKHDVEIFCVAFEPNDQNIAIACGDGSVRILDASKEHVHEPIAIKTH